MIEKPPRSIPWLTAGAGVAALLGVMLLVAGGREMRLKSSTLAVESDHPRASLPASAEGVEVGPVGITRMVDSSNTPPSLLASLVQTGAGTPAADRVEIDIPVSSPETDLPAVPESRLGEAAPEAPIDSVAPPPPGDAADPNGRQSDSSSPDDELSAPMAVAEVSEAGGGDHLLIPPVVTKAAWLVYPREARKRKSEGNVEVRILVDLAGGVSAVEIERGTSDESLNQAALNAARLMRFRPARRGGRPVAVWFNFQFSFRLPS